MWVGTDKDFGERGRKQTRTLGRGVGSRQGLCELVEEERGRKQTRTLGRWIGSRQGLCELVELRRRGVGSRQGLWGEG